MSTFLNILIAIGIGIMLGGVQAVAVHLGERGQPWWAEVWFGLNMVISVVFAALNLVWHEYLWMIAFVIFAIIDGYRWWKWHNRRKKKRPVGALIGAKTRAVRDKLVQKQREATVPTN